MSDENWMIVYGSLGSGYTFMGPFPSHDAALDYATGDDEQWEIVKLEPPETDN